MADDGIAPVTPQENILLREVLVDIAMPPLGNRDDPLSGICDWTYAARFASGATITSCESRDLTISTAFDEVQTTSARALHAAVLLI